MRKLQIIQNDQWLSPFEKVFENWELAYQAKEKELVGDENLRSFAQGYKYFGLHKNGRNWVIRDWAPNATKNIFNRNF